MRVRWSRNCKRHPNVKSLGRQASNVEGGCHVEARRNANFWLLIAFAAVVTEAIPISSLRYLPESLQQMNSKLLAFDMPHGVTEHSISGVLELTVAYFPMLQALAVVGAFSAYLAVTRTFHLRGFLYGLPTALLVLTFGYAGVIAFLIFSSVHLLQPIFYYVVLRSPMFLGLALGLWIAQYKMGAKKAGDKAYKNLSSKLA